MVSFGPTEENPYFDKIHTELMLKGYEYIIFKHNDDEQCAKDLEIPYPSIAMFRKFEPQIEYYTGEANIDKFYIWWFQRKTPVMFRLEDYKDVAFSVDKYPVMIMFRSDSDKDEDYMAEFEDAARENQSKMMFAYQNLDSQYGMKMAKIMEISRHKLPAMRAYLNDFYKFKPTFASRNITAAQVTNFTNEIAE